jgi:hypothetical protein
MKNVPVTVRWFALAFVGGANVACRECATDTEANHQCQQWKQDNPTWRTIIRRVPEREGTFER